MRLHAGVVVALLAARPLVGQTPAGCGREETINECFSRIANALEAQRHPAAATEASDALARKVTGVGSLGAGLASAIGDFLPLLSGAIGLTPTTTEKGGTGFETNIRIPIGASLQSFRVRLGLEPATLFGPLRDSLTASSQEARIGELERGFGDFDDVEVSLAWNLESRGLGRSFEPVRALASNLLTLEREAFSADPEVREMIRLRNDLRRRASRGGLAELDPAMAEREVGSKACRRADAIDAARAWPIACYQAAWQDSINRAVMEQAIVTVASEGKLDSLLRRSGFFRLGDLINNQPQLTFEASRRMTDRLVGPDGYRVAIRYEGGFANVNGLRRFGRNNCGAPTDAAMRPDCLRRYLADPKTAASIRHGDRFFVNLGYIRRDRYRHTLTAEAVSVDLPGHTDLTVGAGYGRYLTFDRAGEALGRIDLGFEYVDTGDDAMRENRWVGAATYTYRLSDALSVAAGVSYASKPEFLGEVSKKVGANFGLRYKLIRD